VTQEMLVDRESVDVTEQRELPEHLGHVVRSDLLVKREVPVFVENEESPVLQEHQEDKDHPVHGDHQENQALMVRRGRRDQLDDRATQVQVGRQEPLDHQVSPGHPDHKDAEVHQETPE